MHMSGVGWGVKQPIPGESGSMAHVEGAGFWVGLPMGDVTGAGPPKQAA